MTMFGVTRQTQTMKLIVFYPHSSLSKASVGKAKFSPKEIVLHTSRSNSLLISVPSIRADGNRRGVATTRSTYTGISAVNDDRVKPSSWDGRPYDSSTLEEISALFKRIQTSIAREKSSTSLCRSSNSSKEKHSAKSREEKSSNRKSDELRTTGWSGELQKADLKTYSPETSEIKPTRPPCKFVKRSPIAPLRIPKGEDDELKSGPSSSNFVTVERKSLEAMKLPQLKEVAKSSGIRGYSKLKKSELLDLLMA